MDYKQTLTYYQRELNCLIADMGDELERGKGLEVCGYIAFERLFAISKNFSPYILGHWKKVYEEYMQNGTLAQGRTVSNPKPTARSR